MMAKRQHTKWKFTASAAEGTFIKVGYVHNKAHGNTEDVICIFVRSKTTTQKHFCRMDEAVILAAGLNKVVAQMMWGQLPIPPETKNAFFPTGVK